MKLASKGFHLVIIDRSGKSLGQVKQSVEDKYPDTKVVQLYFDHEEKDEWEEYEALCQNI